MKFDLIKCRSAQLKFADCFTKNHSVAHHKTLQPTYLVPGLADEQLSMQRCIKILALCLAKRTVTLQTHTKRMSQTTLEAYLRKPTIPVETHNEHIQIVKILQ